MSFKIVKLTPANILALTEMIQYTGTDKLTLTKTTAVFEVANAVQALDLVTEFQRVAVDHFGSTGHPNASLHAVRRKVEALAAAEIKQMADMREASATVEAQRDAGTLAAGLAAAKARSEAQAERDAANDPLVTLLGADPKTGLSYGATIRPKAWVTAHIAEEPARERVYRSKPDAGRVGGRLLVKCGRRRNRG